VLESGIFTHWPWGYEDISTKKDVCGHEMIIGMALHGQVSHFSSILTLMYGSTAIYHTHVLLYPVFPGFALNLLLGS
jgi:hypothetical protein